MGDVSTSVNDSVNMMVQAISNQTVTNIIKCVAVIILGIIIIRYALKLLEKALGKSHVLNAANCSLIKTVVRVILYFMLVVVVAGMIGIPITSFVALFSIIGLAVSLAIQGLLSNLAGGIIIAVSKPFNIGDFIGVGDVSGSVQMIGIIHTRLQTPDGKLLYMPNSTLYTTTLTNFTALGRRRIDLNISASYDNSPEQVAAAIRDAVTMAATDKTCEILEDPPMSIEVDTYGDSAINYVLRVWSSSAAWYHTKITINWAMYEAFARNHVQMTYPHLNVHMQK